MSHVPRMKRWTAVLLLVAAGSGLVLIGVVAGPSLWPGESEQLARPVTCVSDAGIATISISGGGTLAPTYASNAFSAPEWMCQGLYPFDIDDIADEAIGRLQAEGATCGTITFTNGDAWSFEGTPETTSIYSFPVPLPDTCPLTQATIPLPSVPASVECHTPDGTVVYQRERDAGRTCHWIKTHEDAQ